jgi:transglutaminase-like putative cysteine protease
MENEPARWWDFPAAAVLFIALLTSAERLVAAGWTPGLESTAFLAALGAVLGLALGKSRFGRGVAILLALGYSLFFIPWVLGGRLYDEIAWDERLVSLGGRLAEAFLLFLNRQPVEDPILFIAFSSVVFWTLSLVSGYSLTRHARYLAAILPAGIILFLVQLYDPFVPQRVGFLAFYFFLCLVLFGRLNYLRKRSFWQEQHIKLSSESVTDLNSTMLVAAAVLIILAWVAPSPARPIEAARNFWQRVTQPWQPILEDLGNAVAGLEGRTFGVSYDYFGDTLELGRNAATGDTVIFTVQAPSPKEVARYYWRARTYDRYEKDKWDHSFSSNLDYSPAQAPLTLPDETGVNEAEYTFTSTQPLINTLFTPLNPIWFSRPGKLFFVRASDSGLDPILFNARPAIRAGETYQVKSFDFNPTEKQLREAGGDYPDWIASRYLQVPANLSPRLLDLAQELTRNEATPYDKAKAITDYLRDEIRYTKTMPNPPLGSNTLEWFLLDYKQGYCNYYATAEVILLRAVGIPARMAVGFAQGDRDPAQPGLWSVRIRDAHAWPEVYFPNIGWIQFEPTASQPQLYRPSGLDSAAVIIPRTPKIEEEGDNLPAEATPNAQDQATGSGSVKSWLLVWWHAGLLGLALAAVVLLGILAWRYRRRRVVPIPAPIRLKATLERLSLTPPRWLERWAYLAALTPIERTFGVVYQSLRRLGGFSSPSQTPAEAAAALAGLLPEAAAAIRTLLNEYECTLYSLRPGHLLPARRAAATIRKEAKRAVMRNRLASLKRTLAFTRGDAHHG